VPTLYVVHQCVTRAPFLEGWVDEAWAVVKDELPSGPWVLKKIPADLYNIFDAKDVHSLVARDMGPVVIVGSIKESSIAALRERLMMSRVIMPCAQPAQSTDLYECFRGTCDAHVTGDPQLTARLVTALLIVRKLESRKHWGGTSLNKNFLWMYNLPKGGFPKELQPLVAEVANQLLIKGLLTSKRSRRHTKVALNPDRRGDVYAFIEMRRPEDEGLRKYLFGGGETISARALDKWLADAPTESEEGAVEDEGVDEPPV
jgi:hypothetical protein